MRKSLKTECKQLSVALVSRIKLSNCFSMSCVFDSILWEKSWRNRKSCGGKKTTWRQLHSSFHYTKAQQQLLQSPPLRIFPQGFSVYSRKDDEDFVFVNWEESFWLTPESAARDQSALLRRISSRVQGLSQIWASFPRGSLLPFANPSGNPLICNQVSR